jgi:hypothetical protein
MQVVIDYFETGTKEVKQLTGELFFGDALFSDYLGVKTNTGGDDYYTLIPQATVVKIRTPNLDEELYMVNTESIKRSKQIALRNMSREMDRGEGGGAFHG